MTSSLHAPGLSCTAVHAGMQHPNTNTYHIGNNPCYWTLNWFGGWMVMKSVSPKASLSQTWLMSLKGEKIKLNAQRVRCVSHNMESCIFTVAAVSEITALKRRTKCPCITVLKYRPKNPRLYFSEIKPLGLIHIQSLVSSWALGLCNPVLMAVVGKSCFITGQLYDEVLDMVCWADLYLAACPVSSQTEASFLVCNDCRQANLGVFKMWQRTKSRAEGGRNISPSEQAFNADTLSSHFLSVQGYQYVTPLCGIPLVWNI